MATKIEKTKQEIQEEKIKELESSTFTTEFKLKKKNDEGNLVEYTLYYSYDELDVDRIGSAMTCYFAFDEVLGKPVQKVVDLDHVNQQQYLKRFYTSVLFERDEDGNPKEFNPFVQENKAFGLINLIRGKENHQLLDQIKIDFFLNKGEIPTGLQEKVKGITTLMLQEPKVREQLAEQVLNQIRPSKKGVWSKKDRQSFERILEYFSDKK